MSVLDRQNLEIMMFNYFFFFQLFSKCVVSFCVAFRKSQISNYLFDNA